MPRKEDEYVKDAFTKMYPGEKRHPDIHDKVPSEDVGALYEREFKGWSIPEIGLQVFTAGYKLGEAHGYTLGFNKGAKQAINGLVGVADRGMRARKLASGNSLNEPSNKLEAIHADQLTAEVCNILAQYAIMPVDQRVASVITALNSLPGVEIKV